MADIREQDLALKTTIADTDWIRLVTATGNHRMTVGQFKDLIGYTQAKSDISQLQTDVSALAQKLYTTINPSETHATIEVQKEIRIQSGVIRTDIGSGASLVATIPPATGWRTLSATANLVQNLSFNDQYNNISSIPITPSSRLVRVYGIQSFPANTQFELFYIAILVKE